MLGNHRDGHHATTCHVKYRPVFGIWRDLADFQQEANTVEVTAGGAQVERRATVVVFTAHVNATQKQPDKEQNIGRSKQVSRFD